MKTITLLNEKGGVGKTTLAVHLAAGLAIKGYRVILLDTDEQGHSATALGLEKEPGFFELLGRNVKWSQVLRHVPVERYQPPGPTLPRNLYLLPSNVETRALPYILKPHPGQLLKRLQQMSHVIDYVVIDTAPAASLLHLLIYQAADYVLMPTKLETLSFDGIAESWAHLENANDERAERRVDPIHVLGIVPTMYRHGTIEHETNLNLLRQQYGSFVWDPIPLRTVWPDAVSSQWTVFGFAPDSQAAGDAWRLVNRVERRVTHESAQPA